ncbi:MAG TPA: hypothetical protein VKE94_18605, partial [Gemmataceae bacterium]|nr:hypothetical protein [Gemmataceae bacterium]
MLALLAAAVHLLHVTQVQRHARTLLAQATDAENAGDPERAIAGLSRYLQFIPSDAGALAHYAELIDQTASTPAARWRVLDALRQALAFDPTRRDLRRRFVARAMELAAYSESARHLEVLLRIDPEDVDSATQLGRCLEALSEFDLAASTYERAAQGDPRIVEASLRLAGLFLKFGQPWKADEILARLATTHSGDPDSVSRSWKAALEGPPGGIATALVCAAFWAQYGGPHARAALAQLEMLEKGYTPTDQNHLLAALAGAHYHLGHYADAERLARRRAEREPSDLASQVAWLDAALDAGKADVVESLVPAIRRL